MLEAEAARCEEQIDYEPPVVEADDHRFNPVAECFVCEEPTEVIYYCSKCVVPLCPNCVSGPIDMFKDGKTLQTHALCPECPGACCVIR